MPIYSSILIRARPFLALLAVCLLLLLLVAYPTDDLLLYLLGLPVYLHVLLLLNFGLWCWASNLHILNMVGIDTSVLLEGPITTPITSPNSASTDASGHSQNPLSDRNIVDIPHSPEPTDYCTNNTALHNYKPATSTSVSSNSVTRNSKRITANTNGSTPLRHHRTIRALYALSFAFTTLNVVTLWLFSTFSAKWGEENAEFIPLITYIIVLFVTVNPWNIAYYKERSKFLRSIWRSAFGGVFSVVPFSDVILSDILTSFSRVVGDMQLVFCDLVLVSNVADPKPSADNISQLPADQIKMMAQTSGLGGSGGHIDQSSLSDSMSLLTDIVAPMLIALPFLFRLRQCISEYMLTKDLQHKRRHMANAIKYLTSMPVIFSAFQINRLRVLSHSDLGMDPETYSFQFNSAVGLWVLFSTINSLYSLYWDVVMDWNLCAPTPTRSSTYIQVCSPTAPKSNSLNTSSPSSFLLPLVGSAHRDKLASDDPAYSRSYQRAPFMLRRIRHFRYLAPYYLAIAVNCVLRLSWVAKVSLLYRLVDVYGHHESISRYILDAQLLGTLVAVDLVLKILEIVRRWVWVFFRIEREWVSKQESSILAY
ncbi:hypothetical protein BASA84_001644 [Batrachochytrium salamandrivorans]|nr:hypothetical protein BASA84_001644 [Batrachochytrium salamandrivorans]